MLDRATHTAVISMKLLRCLALWLGVWLADKVAQDAYVERVLVAGASPPGLGTMVLVVSAVDASVTATALLFMILAAKVYLRGGPTFVVDAPLVRLVALDAFATGALFVGLALWLGRVVESSPGLRYRDDGLRAVRAFSTMLLALGVIVVFLPAYRVIADLLR